MAYMFYLFLRTAHVSVFSPFETAANRLRYEWVQSHPGRVMQMFDLPPIFARALQIGATEPNIISSFRATGIWPYDSQIFQEIDFMPSETTNRAYTPEEIINEEDILMGDNIELPHRLSENTNAMYEGDEFDFISDVP